MKDEAVREAAKGALAVGGAAGSAFTLNEMVAVATGVYILVQMVYLLRKWWCEEKDRGRGKGRR